VRHRHDNRRGGRLERNAIGVELEPRWSRLAAHNVAYARSRQRACVGRILTGDARRLPRLLSSKAARSLCEPSTGNVARLPFAIADLVLTSPPYACEVGDVDRSAWHTGRNICREDSRNYSPDKENVGHARGSSYAAAMSDIYRACAAVTKPGGFVVVVTKNTRMRGAMRNLAGETIELCEQAGLRYWQHVIGLLATIRGDTLVPRPSFWQLLQTRRGIERGERPHLVCHEDVLVFRKPSNQAAAVCAETRKEAC
jgi:hypothetical protein